MAEETKKDQRVKAPVLRAKYKSRTLDEFIEKYSRDISRSGMFIKSAKPPALGTLLKVEILLEDGTPVIAAVGRVVKRREDTEATPTDPAGMGIRFLKVEDASQPVIDRIVALKGEDAGPHFENIRTGQTVPPPPMSTGEHHSAFFGTTNPAKEMPAEADRTMMRQMNALLGEALRQVNEAPRKDPAAVPTQKATIMGVAAPAGMLEQALAAAREEAAQKKTDDGPTKVATRGEIDDALQKLKAVEEPAAAANAEATRAEAAKPEAAKAEAPKADEKPAEPAKAEAPKADEKPAEPAKAEAPKAEEKPAEPVAEAPKPDESAVRSVPPRALTTVAASVPPPPAQTPEEKPAEPVKAEAPKAEEKPAEPAKAEAPAEPAKVEETPAEPAKAEEPAAKAAEPAAEVKSEEKPAEPAAKAEEPAKAEAPKAEEKPAEPAKAEAPAAEVKAEEKPAEPAPKAEEKAPAAEPAKVEAAKVEAKKSDSKKPEKKSDEKKSEAKKSDEKKSDEKKPEAKKSDEKKSDEKKPELKKSDEKKPEAAGGMNMVTTLGAIAVVAFLVWFFLLRNP